MNLAGFVAFIPKPEKIRKLRTVAGVKSNVLELQIRGKTYYYINLQSAESRIRDLDMAREVSVLMKNSLLLKMNYGIILISRLK